MSWSASPDRPMFLLYDGSCRFCTAGSQRLLRFARPGTIRRISNKDDAQMALLPERARAGVASALQLVSPDGDIASGAEAVNRALATRPAWRLITWLYWLPILKQLTDFLYTLVAKNRYRIMGKVQTCDSGACKLDETNA